jgi:hypothetical protein
MLDEQLDGRAMAVTIGTTTEPGGDLHMTSSAIRLPLAALAALALLVAIAPAAMAAPSLTDQAFARGLGSAYTPSIAQSNFAAAACFVDEEGDVVGPEGPIEESRADIVEHCVNFTSSRLTLEVTTASPVDPATDPNWAGSAAIWLVDTTGDDDGEFAVTLSRLESDNDELEVTVEDITVEGGQAVEDCDGDYEGFEDGAIRVSIDVDCIDDPDDIRVAASITYDARVSDPAGEAAFDAAPDDGTLDGDVKGSFLEPGVTRFFGQERIETAIEISQGQFGDGEADTVLLARADLFPDALAGTPLAVELDAPILLTPTDSLSEATAAEIERVTGGEGRVVILGGEVAVSAEVEQQLRDLGYDITRYGGENRFETAVEIATEGLGSPSTVLVADGGDFPDALIAGTSAPAVDGAVLLTDGEEVPAVTQAYLDANADLVYAIGETAVEALPEAERVAGAGPIGTSVLAAETFYPEVTIVGIARVDEFADALTGGALIANPAAGPGPILFVESDNLPDVVEAYLLENPIDTVVIFGGEVAVSSDVEDEIATAIASDDEVPADS